MVAFEWKILSESRCKLNPETNWAVFVHPIYSHYLVLANRHGSASMCMKQFRRVYNPVWFVTLRSATY
jgi:hypothetical protein